MRMEEDLFKEEDDFSCSICGKKIKSDDEIIEEICHVCLSSILENKDTSLDNKSV